ncbi:hypothetical protein H9P43_003582 [Blastocladiella emersonii ATCC 22665]|nr:hypothetical protein H9P43_003582 [Blastocladiella emersonii ATCC 22665]
MCGIGTTASATKPMSDHAKAELEASFSQVKIVLINEISMVGAEPFAAMHLRFDAPYPSRDHLFILVQKMRYSGDASFFNVLQDLRNCVVSQRVIEYLGSRRADVVLGQHPDQLDDWSDQVLITTQNLQWLYE